MSFVKIVHDWIFYPKVPTITPSPVKISIKRVEKKTYTPLKKRPVDATQIASYPDVNSLLYTSYVIMEEKNPSSSEPQFTSGRGGDFGGGGAHGSWSSDSSSSNDSQSSSSSSSDNSSSSSDSSNSSSGD